MSKKQISVKSLCFYMVLLFISSASAQSKEVTSIDVRKMEQKAMELLRSVPYRSTTIAETFPVRGEAANWKSKMILEVVPPDRTRQVQETLTSEKPDRREIISVSGTYSQRFNDGPWQVLPPPPDYVGPRNETPPIPVLKPKFEIQTRLVETLTENGRTVSVYEIKNKFTREVDGKEAVQLTSSRFWFRDDGFLLKKFAELENVGDPKIVINTTVYDYDNIKIEAPITN